MPESRFTITVTGPFPRAIAELFGLSIKYRHCDDSEYCCHASVPRTLLLPGHHEYSALEDPMHSPKEARAEGILDPGHHSTTDQQPVSSQVTAVLGARHVKRLKRFFRSVTGKPVKPLPAPSLPRVARIKRRMVPLALKRALLRDAKTRAALDCVDADLLDEWLHLPWMMGEAVEEWKHCLDLATSTRQTFEDVRDDAAYADTPSGEFAQEVVWECEKVIVKAKMALAEWEARISMMDIKMEMMRQGTHPREREAFDTFLSRKNIRKANVKGPLEKLLDRRGYGVGYCFGLDARCTCDLSKTWKEVLGGTSIMYGVGHIL